MYSSLPLSSYREGQLSDKIDNALLNSDTFMLCLQYTTLANGLPIPADYAGKGFPPATGGSVCAVVLSASPQFPGSVSGYVLGDPFMAKFPGTFFGPGVIASIGSRGVPLSLGPNLGGGKNGKPEDDVCLYGTVPVRAKAMLRMLLPNFGSMWDLVCSQCSSTQCLHQEETMELHRIVGQRGWSAPTMIGLVTINAT